MGNKAFKFGKKELVDQAFQLLDTSRDGEISVAELRAWIQDERFLDNAAFLELPIREQVQKMFWEIDKNGDGKISKKEFSDYMEQAKDVEILASTFVDHAKAKRKERITEIFKRLDKNGDGELDKAELMAWVSNEPYFQALATVGFDSDRGREKRDELMHELDHDKNKTVSLQEMLAYFERWTVRELRLVSQNLLRKLNAKEDVLSRIFVALGVSDGHLQSAEFYAWLQDEVYLQNKLLTDPENEKKAKALLSQTASLTKLAGDQKDGDVEVDDLTPFFREWSVEDMKQLAAALLDDSEEQWAAAVTLLCQAMDISNDKYIDKREVNAMLSGVEFPPHLLRCKDVIASLDKRSCNRLSYVELGGHLIGFTMRQLQALRALLLRQQGKGEFVRERRNRLSVKLTESKLTQDEAKRDEVKSVEVDDD